MNLSIVKFRAVDRLEELMAAFSVIGPLAVREGMHVSGEEMVGTLIVKTVVVPV